MRCDEVMDWVDEATPEELYMLPIDIQIHVDKCPACAGYVHTGQKFAGLGDETPGVDLWPRFVSKLKNRNKVRNIWVSVASGAMAIAASLMIAILPMTNKPGDGVIAQKRSAAEYAQAVNVRSGDMLNIVNEAYKIDDSSDENQDDTEREALDYYYALADNI